jgi:hypothetical protein
VKRKVSGADVRRLWILSTFPEVVTWKRLSASFVAAEPGARSHVVSRFRPPAASYSGDLGSGLLSCGSVSEKFARGLDLTPEPRILHEASFAERRQIRRRPRLDP